MKTKIVVSSNRDTGKLMDIISQKMKDGIIARFEINNMYMREMEDDTPRPYAREIIISYSSNPSVSKAIAVAMLFDGDESAAEGYNFL